jgi:hypothetical protein
VALCLAQSRTCPVGEPGRATLAVLMGPAGQGRDEVAQLLISERGPFVTALKREEGIGDHWVWWHRGPIVVVLVDPQPSDWLARTCASAAGQRHS